MKPQLVPIRNPVTSPNLTARDVACKAENPTHYQDLLNDFLQSWAPRNPFEASLVHRLAQIQFRLNRCAKIETGLFNQELAHPSQNPSPNAATATAFNAQESTFNTLSRIEANLWRDLDRTQKQLLAVRRKDFSPQISHYETKPIRVENKQPPNAAKASSARSHPESDRSPMSCAPSNRTAEHEFPSRSRETLHTRS
ncbi:MAG: hypothetical protein ABI972_09585 [Acidobacteriota bacterium]